MNTKQQQPLPAATRQRIEEWMNQRERLAELINASLFAARDALGVPPNWVVRDIGEGFIDPAMPEGENVNEG